MRFHLRRTFLYRLDSGGGVRVGDFGLAEDVYASGYFRQKDRANVKLPYKWMALESLNDAIFTEKTDVVSQCVHGIPITAQAQASFLCNETSIVYNIMYRLMSAFSLRYNNSNSSYIMYPDRKHLQCVGLTKGNTKKCDPARA